MRRTNAFSVRNWWWEERHQTWWRQHAQTGAVLGSIFPNYNNVVVEEWLAIVSVNATPDIILGGDFDIREHKVVGAMDLLDCMAEVDAMLLQIGWVL